MASDQNSTIRLFTKNIGSMHSLFVDANQSGRSGTECTMEVVAEFEKELFRMASCKIRAVARDRSSNHSTWGFDYRSDKARAVEHSALQILNSASPLSVV